MTWREGGDLDSKKKEEEAKNDLEEEEEEEEGRKSAGHSQQFEEFAGGAKMRESCLCRMRYSIRVHFYSLVFLEARRIIRVC